MASEVLTVIARFEAKPGKEEQLRQDLVAMIAPSRQDEGCLTYDILQSREDPKILFTYENWTGKPALDKHMQTPHFQALGEKNKQTLAKPMDVQLLTKQNDQEKGV